MTYHLGEQTIETERLKAFVRSLGIDLVSFDDHPDRREDVLDIQACLGDEGCKVCLVVCPWTKAENIR